MLLWLAAAIVCLVIGKLDFPQSVMKFIVNCIGIRHQDECDNLESNLPIYLIVQGVLSLIYSVTCGFGCCFLANCRKTSSWIVFTIAIANVTLSIVLIVWTIVGSVWLWNNWEDWDDNRELCANEVYITAMASLIVNYTFWLYVFSFAGCQVFWSFCDKDDTQFA